MVHDESSADAPGGIQSLDAALRLLAILARQPGPLGVTDLARATDIQPSRAHRYLASFIHAGLVQQYGRSGRYDLGPAAIEMGLAALDRHDFVNDTADHLQHFTEQTGLTTLLTVWGTRGPTVIRWQRTPSFIQPTFGLGTTLPLLSSATGRIWLSYLPQTRDSHVCAAELTRARASPDLFDDLELTRAGLDTFASAVRSVGVATVDGRFIPGLVAAAAPVLDWEGTPQVVVTMISADHHSIEPTSTAIAALRQFCAERSLPRTTPEGWTTPADADR